jgi:hypothetical protein
VGVQEEKQIFLNPGFSKNTNESHTVKKKGVGKEKWDCNGWGELVQSTPYVISAY